MRTHWIMAATLGILLSACASMQLPPTQDERQALAPTGKLRAGLSRGAPLHVIQDPASGEMKGVGFELGKELARRLEVPFEPVLYPIAGAIVSAAEAGQWDVAFLGVIPEMAKAVDLTAPYAEIEFGYLVLGSSSISTAAEVDRPGTKVAVAARGAADILLSRGILKNAVVLRGADPAAALDLVKSGKADMFAANKPNLFETRDRLPGSRVLDGEFGREAVAMAIPKGRDRGLPYLRRFIEDAKATGLVKAAIDRAQVRGVVVAPAQ